MTNYEKIKQMSVEELARFLNDNGICHTCAHEVFGCGNCLKGHIAWLEREVDQQ